MKHSDEDIEKVARAIALMDMKSELHWVLYRPLAYAAITAMFKPREPREFWLYKDNDDIEYQAQDDKPFGRWDDIIHVREVIG